MRLSMLFAIASVYLLSCTIEASPIVDPADHQTLTVYNVIYGMFTAMLAVYAIMKLTKAPVITALWIVSCHAGAIFFALLAQVPWLKNLTLTPGWLQRLSPQAAVVVATFIVILLVAGMRQARETCRMRDWSIKIHAYVVIAVAYFIVFVLIATKGDSYHFHVHHAIAAVCISAFFTNWLSRVDVILHGILIGIAIEGIAFFGTTEAMLFMIHNGDMKYGTILASWSCIAVLGLIWAHIQAKKQIRIYSIPLET